MLTEQILYDILYECSTRAHKMREWLSGGAPPCQGGGRGFESRLALLFFTGDESSPVFILFQQEEFFSISLFVSPSNFFAKPSKSAFSSNCRQRNFVLTYLSQPSLVCDFCPSNQRFAYSFLQIPPYDGHPCLRLYPSHYRANFGLIPVRNVRRRAHNTKNRR